MDPAGVPKIKEKKTTSKKNTKTIFIVYIYRVFLSHGVFPKSSTVIRFPIQKKNIHSGVSRQNYHVQVLIGIHDQPCGGRIRQKGVGFAGKERQARANLGAGSKQQLQK